MYAQDYDARMPQTEYADPNALDNAQQPHTHWSYIVQPYIKNQQIFVCPSDTHPAVAQAGDLQAPKYSYINNYNAIPSHEYQPPSDAAIENSASLILLTERRAYGGVKETVLIDPYKGANGFQPNKFCPNAPGALARPICARPDPNRKSTERQMLHLLRLLGAG